MRNAIFIGGALAGLQVVLTILLGSAPGWSKSCRTAPRGMMAEPLAPDARTAPLVAAPPSLEVARPHPFVVPRCPDVAATIVSEAPDSAHSRATLRAPGEGGGRALRFGGSIGARRVVYVGTNPLLHSPAVWLTDGEALCQAVLGQPPGAAVAVRAESRARNDGERLTRFVERVDDDSFRIDRRLLHLALGDSQALQPALRGVRGNPTGDGFRLARVPAGSLLAALGLQSGDLLVALDDHPMVGPGGLVAAYALLQRGAPVQLSVRRGERSIRLAYAFE